MKWIPALFLFFLVACKGNALLPYGKSEMNHPVQAEENVRENSPSDEIVYLEFKPKELKKNPIQGFELWRAYAIQSNQIVIGSYKSANGEIAPPDSENDYGRRLLLLDQNNQIKFKSSGSMDVYLYEPHFFKSDRSNKIIVICQQAFEYYCGGDAFVLENGKMKEIGYLNIESNDPEQSLVEIIQIKEKKDQLIFTFAKDSLLLDLGGQTEKLIKNKDVRYVYEHRKLQLYK